MSSNERLAEPKPPASLATLQREFGRAISEPFDLDGGEYSVRSDRYPPAIVSRMVPRGELAGVERLAVYNEQYWFRLLGVMQEEYPLLEALLGIDAFNELAMEYLDAHPPDSPRLRDLSSHLLDFLDRHEEWGSARNVQVAKLEWIHIQAFDAASLEPLTPDEETAIRPLTFQPHVFRFDEDYNFVELRARVKRGEDVTEADLERGRKSWVIYRNRGIESFEIGPIQVKLLDRLRSGVPFADAIERVADQLTEDELTFLETHVRRWFALWSSLGWFASHSS